MARVLYVVFFMSGFAGLVYESVWTRYLGLFVGHSAYAQVVVLTVFLGGLSVGSLLAGRWSERVRWPVLWYAGVELAVGVMGLMFHDTFVSVQSLARTQLFPALAGGPFLGVAKWGLAGGLILPPAVLLGTTFPLMSATLVRLAPARPGRTLSLLYFANSFGAAVGALFAGFVLLGWVGLPGTLLFAAGVNAAVALVAWLSSFGLPVDEATRPVRYDPAPSPREDSADRLWRFLLAVSFGTAVASFIYEIAWTRMLSLVLGSATHAFELMLSAFILGLAIGALVIQRRADTFTRPLRVLGVIQWCMGLAALATLPVYLESFSWTATLLQLLVPTVKGYAVFNVGRYGLALAVMLPSTICAGMTLPLITRVLLTGPRGERAIGWVYGVNTLGSIAGVVVAALVLMPLIGLKALLVVGAVLDMGLGVALLRYWAREAKTGSALPWMAVAATAVVTAVIAVVTPFDRALLNSGVFRSGSAERVGVEEFWKDGRTASVGVRKDGGLRSITTNGKVEATLTDEWIEGRPSGEPGSMTLDEPTQTLAALVALAHAPEARTGAVIGQGSGMLSHLLLGSPALQELVTVEIEPAMIEGSRLFLPANRRVFEDPRSTFVIDDAKSYFASSQRRFDLIVSEPSNPWVSGVSSLFTLEFYDLVSRQLAPGGVFGQWFHLYEVDDELVLTVLAALHQMFRSYELFLVNETDVLVVASNEATLPTPDWTVADLPGIAEDLQHFHRLQAPYLERTRFLTRRALAPLVEKWPPANSDYFPVLELGAERARFLRGRAVGFLGAAEASFDPSDVFLPDLVDLDATEPSPVPAILSMAELNLASKLRADREGTLVADEDDRVLARARFDEEVLSGFFADSGPPRDWPLWLGVFRAVAARRHDATRGWIDSDLYDRAEAYAEERGAPDAVRTGLAFDRALRMRDWPAVARAAVAAVPGTGTPNRSDYLIDPDLLRDAGVMALLLTDQVPDARRLYDALRPVVSRPSTDLRSLLLGAYLDRAEAGGSL